jgi:hypothetical protein
MHKLPQGLERSSENEEVSSPLERRASIMELACRNIINAISGLSSIWRAHIRQGRKCLGLYRSQLSQNHLSLLIPGRWTCERTSLLFNHTALFQLTVLSQSVSRSYSNARVPHRELREQTHRELVGRTDIRTQTYI